MKVLYKGLPTIMGEPVNSSEYYYVLTGDSSEAANLPTDDVMDGSIFIQTDSHDSLMFNAKTSAWG